MVALGPKINGQVALVATALFALGTSATSNVRDSLREKILRKRIVAPLSQSTGWASQVGPVTTWNDWQTALPRLSETVTAASPTAVPTAPPAADQVAIPDFVPVASGPVFTGYAPAVHALSAKFSNDYNSILVTFDSNVAVLASINATSTPPGYATAFNGRISCGDVFENLAGARLFINSMSVCDVKVNLNTITIVLPYNFYTIATAASYTPVNVGSSLSILGSKLGALGALWPNVTLTSTNLTVAAADLGTPKPDLSYVAASPLSNSILGPEGVYTIDLSVIPGGGGSPMTITVVPVGSVLPAVYGNITAQLSSGFIDFTPEITPPGNYTFNVTATNRFNNTDSILLKTQRFPPNVALPPPPKRLPPKVNAPVVTSALMSDDGAFFAITFDKSIALFNASATDSDGLLAPIEMTEELPCGRVFANRGSVNATGLLWRNESAETDCTFIIIDDTITFSLDYDFSYSISNSFKPGNSLTLLPNVLGNADSTNPILVGAGVVVTVNKALNPPAPSINKFVSDVVPSCGDITVDLMVTGQGSQPWVTATLTIANTTASAINITAINALLAAGLMDMSTPILFDNTKVPVGSYIFTAAFTNSFGLSATVSYPVIRSSSASYPDIKFVPSFDSVAPVDDFSVIEAIITPPPMACNVSETRYTFLWSQVIIPGVPTVSFQPGADFTRPSLEIPPYALAAGIKYRFKVVVSAESAYTSIFDFTADTGFIGGDLPSTSIGELSNYNLIPFVFNSAIQGQADPADYSCVYSCINVAGALCVTKAGTQFNTSASTSCAGIAIGNLFNRGTYTFQATITNTKSKISGQTAAGVITVLAGATPPPKVDIFFVNAPNGAPVAGQSDFALNATVRTDGDSADTDLMYTWTASTKCGSSSYEPLNAANTDFVPTGNTGLGLSFISFSAQAFVPGRSYCIQLMVKDTLNPTTPAGVAYKIFAIKIRPSKGKCVRTNANVPATELTGPVTIGCSGWTVDPTAKPLLYAFLISNDGTNFVPFGNPSTEPNPQIILPAGNYTIRPIILDSAGAQSDIQSTISVTVDPLSHLVKRANQSVALNYLTGVQNSYRNSRNTKVLIQALSTVAISDKFINDRDVVGLGASLLLESLGAQTCTKKTAEALTGLAGRFSQSPALNQTLKESLLGFTVNLIANTLKVGLSSNPPTCAEPATLQQWGLMIGRMIDSSKSGNSLKLLKEMQVNIASCGLIGQQLGNPPTSIVGSNYTQSIGNTYVNGSSATFGTFTAVPRTTINSRLRLKFTTATSKGDYNSINGTDGTISSLSLFDSTTNAAYTLAGNYSFCIAVSSSARSLVTGGSKKFVMKYINYTTAGSYSDYTLSASGITTNAVLSNGQLCAISTHLTDFIVGLEDVSGSSSSSTVAVTATSTTAAAATTTANAGVTTTTSTASASASTTAKAGEMLAINIPFSGLLVYLGLALTSSCLFFL